MGKKEAEGESCGGADHLALSEEQKERKRMKK
jgi:hypothetical protein